MSVDAHRVEHMIGDIEHWQSMLTLMLTVMPSVKRDVAVLQSQLAALEEAARWHRWPEEKPTEPGLYDVTCMFTNGPAVDSNLWMDDGTWSRGDYSLLAWRKRPEPYVPKEPE